MPWFIGCLIAIVACVLGLNWLFPGVLASEGARIQLAYGLVLLTVLASSLVLGFRARLGEALRYGLIWSAILLALVTVYSYKDGFASLAGRTVEVLVPELPVTVDGTVKVRPGLDGHFTIIGYAEGKRVRFMVDTGATYVVLSPADARRIGLDTKRLAYVEPVSTANGITYVAKVRLKELNVGDIEQRNIEAMVARDGLDQSLLGMSFLERFDISITREELTLKSRS